MAAPCIRNTISRANFQSQGSSTTSSRYSFTKQYEAKLQSIKNGALVVAVLQKVSRFFGICALTWATVVLLGGFASSLRLLDFYLISILLLLEAARLTTTQFFTSLLSKTLFREGQFPQEFQFKDLQYFWASRVDLIGQASSCFVAMVGIALAAARFGVSAHHPLTERNEPKKGHGNLSPALYAFYVLVILNSATAMASAIYRPIVRSSSEDSLMCYHDEVYKTAMNVGMSDADEIDIFNFAFKKLANDHRRNIRPPTIKERNKDLIKYLYQSQNGVEVTCEYLKSDDVWKQVVAANLPGFWVDQSRIKKQVGLIWALQERLYGTGKVAEAAANSIRCLSNAWADDVDQHPFLMSDRNKNDAPNVVDTLIDLVIEPIRSSVLFQLRALEACCRSQVVLQHIYSQSSARHGELRKELQDMIAETQSADQHDAQLGRPQKLCRRLQSIVSSCSPRETTKIYAASALHSLLCFEGAPLEGHAKKKLQRMVENHIKPAESTRVTEDGKREYLWKAETEMLDKLRGLLDLPRYDWDGVKVVPALNDADKVKVMQMTYSSV